MPKDLEQSYTPPDACAVQPPPSTGKKEALLIPESREALLDATAQRLRFLWEMKKSVPHGGYGGASGPMPAPHLHKPPAGLEDLLVDAARLSVKNAEDWVKLGQDHFERILALLRALTGTSAPAPIPQAMIKLDLKGMITKPPTTADSQHFAIQNPFREEVSVTFTHPFFWLQVGDAPPPPIDQQFAATVTLIRLRKGQRGWVRDRSGDDPVPGTAFKIAPQTDVHLAMKVLIAPPFHVPDGEPCATFAGEGRLLSDRRLGGVLRFSIEVKK
jgi:hypothetical protein